jgi:hypothetical protein
MTNPKVRRVRVCTRLSVPVRERLTKYCAASGISERTLIENAILQYLEGTGDRALFLSRFDQLAKARAEDHHDQLLSEAFGLFVRLWFARTPVPEANKAAARGAGDAAYQHFVDYLARRFGEGHRFRDDVPNSGQ